MNNLIIKNSKGHVLSTFEEWKKGFIEVDSKKHWNEGYSAQSLCKLFTERDGQRWVNELIKELFNDDITYREAEIEHESKLDNYRGKQRMQDLAIWGNIGGHNVFIAIEAKVLESFGNYSVRDEYEQALIYKKKKPSSNKSKRIEEIVCSLFPKSSPYNEKVCNLRYQLLHYLRASINEGISLSESKKPIAKRLHPSIVILPVLVFKTKHFEENTDKANLNHRDYLAFCSALAFEKKTFGKRTVFFKEIDKCEVFTFYEEISIQ